MAFMRRIFSPWILIVIVVVLVALYVYRDRLFTEQAVERQPAPTVVAEPPDAAKAGEEPIAAMPQVAPAESEAAQADGGDGAQTGALPGPQQAAPQPDSAPAAAETAAAAEPEAVPAAETAAAPATDSGETVARVKEAASTALESAQRAAQRAAQTVTEAKDEAVAAAESAVKKLKDSVAGWTGYTPQGDATSAPGPDAPQPATGSEPEPAPAPGSSDTAAASVTEQLQRAARTAFWREDYAAAEASYREWAQHAPLDPDPHGELGNVYYSQGQWVEAGAAYAEAADRLAAAGQHARARALLRIIQGLDPDRARELEARWAQP